ncbi:MAG: hypothetical protein M3O91_03500 [Chloroflexota bacterium]|nr:hypothetical protein [Chloroflexota bacterium]
MDDAARSLGRGRNSDAANASVLVAATMKNGVCRLDAAAHQAAEGGTDDRPGGVRGGRHALREGHAALTGEAASAD